MHTLTDCPVPTPARVDLVALGDFPTTNNTSESLSLAAQNTPLAFPANTLALQAKARADSSDRSFIGYSQASAQELDFLLWPQGESCELFRGDVYPGALGGEAIGYAAPSGLLMIAGNDVATGSAVVGALTFDSRSGEAIVIKPRDSMIEPRAFASVTEFGPLVLVAGGEDPIHDSSQPAAVLRDTAEVYDPALHAFQAELVKLAVASTRHTAVTLSNGETALIGGQIAASRASSFVQVVSPETRASKLIGTLNVARSAPVALRLSDDRVLVAGGEDASGRPVPELEWLAANADPLGAPFDGSVRLPPRFGRAFAALPGGAALAVGGCEDRAPAAGEDCAAWCERGCPPLEAASAEAFWISADGVSSALELPTSANAPVLLPGSDGRPWLLADATNQAGTPLPGGRALYRFDPWQQAFTRIASAISERASRNARFTATGLDAFVWLQEDEAGPVLRGLRLGTRSAFSNDVPLFAHLVPDRAPDSGISYDAALSNLSFAALDVGVNAPCAWISDALYADFSARIDFTSREAPTLRLGALSVLEAPQAGSDCALPASNRATQGGSIRLRRLGNQLDLSIGSASSRCSLTADRVALGVCASELGPIRVSLLEVTRGG